MNYNEMKCGEWRELAAKRGWAANDADPRQDAWNVRDIVWRALAVAEEAGPRGRGYSAEEIGWDILVAMGWRYSETAVRTALGWLVERGAVERLPATGLRVRWHYRAIFAARRGDSKRAAFGPAFGKELPAAERAPEN